MRTLNLDRLAAEGTSFDWAYANSPMCVPSRLSLMPGQYVHQIGAWDNGVVPARSSVPGGTTCARPGTRAPSRHDVATTDAALAFLRDPGPEPFLLYVGYMHPRFPVVAPSEFREFYHHLPQQQPDVDPASLYRLFS